MKARGDGDRRGWLAALGASGVIVIAIVAAGATLGGAVLFSDFPVDLSEPGEEEVQVATGGGELGGLLGLGGAGAAAAGGALGATVGAAAASSLDAAGEDSADGGGADGGSGSETTNGTGGGEPGGTGGETGTGGGGEGGDTGEGDGGAPGGGAGSPSPPADEEDGVLDDTVNHLSNTVEALVAGDFDSALGGVPRTVGDGLVRDVGDLVDQRSVQNASR